MIILLLILVGWPLAVACTVLYVVWSEIGLALAGRFIALSLAMVACLAWTLQGNGQTLSMLFYAVSAVGWFVTLVHVSKPTYK